MTSAGAALFAVAALLTASTPAPPGAATAPARPDTPQQRGAPAAASTTTRLDDVCGTFIEVVRSEQGYKKTARCGPDDQLIIARAATGLSLRWSGTPSARPYPEAAVDQDRVVLRERRRTIYLERVDEQVIRVSFERRNRTKSYLYGRLDFALPLPTAAKDEKGCDY